MARRRDSCFLQPPPPTPTPADWGRHHAPGCPAHAERTAPRTGFPPRPRLLSQRRGAEAPACSGEDHACLLWGPSCSRTFPLPQGVFTVCKAPRSVAAASSQRPRGSGEPQSSKPDGELSYSAFVGLGAGLGPQRGGSGPASLGLPGCSLRLLAKGAAEGEHGGATGHPLGEVGP